MKIQKDNREKKSFLAMALSCQLKMGAFTVQPIQPEPPSVY